MNDYKLLIYDFDGVMTDNRVVLSETGEESVVCNRSDGLAIEKFRKLGLHQIIISTEKNQVVRKRAAKLKLDVWNNISNKKETLISILQKLNIDHGSAIFFGNDLNDLEVMKYCGLSVAPKDAAPEILDIADIITNARGGEGVIREFYSMYLKRIN